jgi:branched-chain amino acid transport system permease protein
MYAQYLANGLMIGGLYACLGVGFALIWGVLNIVNMIHGTMVVVGAYITIIAVTDLGVPIYLAAILAGLGLFAIGYVLQRGVINAVVAQPILITLTLTFGLDLILHNVLINMFTATPRSLTASYGSVQFMGVYLPVVRLVAVLIAIALTALLYVLLRRSKLGWAIIAVRMDSHAARLMGIKIPQIYALTFGVGAFMAGVAGATMAAVYPITPLMSGLFLGKVFVICVVGGLGSVPGAIIGGLTLGLIESFGSLAIGSQWTMTVGYTAMLLILLFKPTGLVGKRGFD